jgi:uncharacterized membrane protein
VSVLTSFHGSRFRHLRNIAAITATILEAVILVLLIEGLTRSMALRWLHVT